MDISFTIPSALLFGKGSRNQTGRTAKKYGITHALVVTGSRMKDHPFFRDVLQSLAESGVSYCVFSNRSGEPTDHNVTELLSLLKSDSFNGIIAVGGGSAIDTAKAANICLTNGGTIADYEGYFRVQKPGLPLLALPTTAGAGSEVTKNTIIHNTKTNVKMLCLDPAFLPTAAIVDYEFTLSMPKHLTAYVGMDALTHAVEAFVSKKATPLSDLYALKAVSLIKNALLSAYLNPNDQLAREELSLAATCAGIAFANASVCTVHGMSRPIGAYFSVPHGLSNAFLLHTVTKHSILGNETRYGTLAKETAIANASDSFEVASEKLVSFFCELTSSLAIPSIREYGISEAEFFAHTNTMAQDALASGSCSNNPKSFSAEELCLLYKEAYYGQI